jgi:hypothetical protein
LQNFFRFIAEVLDEFGSVKEIVVSRHYTSWFGRAKGLIELAPVGGKCLHASLAKRIGRSARSRESRRPLVMLRRLRYDTLPSWAYFHDSAYSHNVGESRTDGRDASKFLRAADTGMRQRNAVYERRSALLSP